VSFRWRTLEPWQRRTIIFSLVVIVVPPALLYYCSRPDYLKRIDRPLTIEEARHTDELRDFPFPPTARRIYFVGYVDWTKHEAAIRFEAAPDECLASIQKIIHWHEIGTGYRHFDMYPTHPITSETRLAGFFHIADVGWWEEPLIKRGFIAGGEMCCGKPNVWLDSDLGRVYYYTRD